MIKPKKEEGRAGTDMLQDLRIYPPFSVTTKVKCMNWEPPAINKGVEALVMCCCIYGVGAGFPTDLGSFFILLIFLSAVGLVLCSCDCSRVWRFSAAIAFCPAGPLLFGSCSAGLLGSDGGLSAFSAPSAGLLPNLLLFATVHVTVHVNSQVAVPGFFGSLRAL
ncbi:unnamed protein product [Ilex paraguariensis]|uniref:Uncharacterized protein n=1 Tax=Ilex paraguariensis TaxID=185542 RepID=A0ABC8SGX2_9AQUA